MAYVNQTTNKTIKHRRADSEHERHREAAAHANWMGGPSYFLSDPVAALQVAASSCFFGEPQYYHRDNEDARPRRLTRMNRYGSALTDSDVEYLRERLDAISPQDWRGKSPADMMVAAIDKALEHDAERTLDFAAWLRNEGGIRVTPQIILVRAAHVKSVKGTGLVRKYAKQIIRRGDEPATGMAYQLGTYGRKAIPNSLKKAWADAYERFDEYSLAKYRLESREVKSVDVVNLAHPSSEHVDKLHRGELRVTGRTWEGIVSEKGSTTEAWREALDVMPHKALLSNVRNLLQNGVEPREFVGNLVKGAEKGWLLPFRYYSAYKAVACDAPGSVLDAIEASMEASMGNLPNFKGRVASLCDNSGSAWGTTTSSMGTMRVAEIANLTGVITGKASDEGYVGVFGDRLEMVSVRKSASVFDQVETMDRVGHGIGGGTENGIWQFWDHAIREKEHWDHVFVYSDEQAGHGGLFGCDSSEYRDYVWGSSGRRSARHIDVPKLITAYREKVNPDVMVYLVQVAGYQDVLIPEFYDRTFILGGWSSNVLRFAAQMSSIYEQASQ